MIDLGLILRHRIPQLNPGYGLYSTGLWPCTPLFRKTTMAKIPDKDIEMFLNDLTEEDWVFMLDKEGRLKALMVPKLEVGVEVNETVLNIFDVIDPAVLVNIMDLKESVVDETDLEEAIQQYKKLGKNTLH